jgi:hypothetical protein
MSVMIKRSPQGSVVIVREFWFTTASALMPYAEAKRLAKTLKYDAREEKEEEEENV